jgi:hypothetical protein
MLCGSAFMIFAEMKEQKREEHAGGGNLLLTLIKG